MQLGLRLITHILPSNSSSRDVGRTLTPISMVGLAGMQWSWCVQAVPARKVPQGSWPTATQHSTTLNFACLSASVGERPGSDKGGRKPRRYILEMLLLVIVLSPLR